MCGIAGYWPQASGKGSVLNLQAMLAKIRHRGPDDGGILRYDLASRQVASISAEKGSDEFDQAEGGGILLGHRRLSILDLSSAGHQPMGTPDQNCWITFNGEIYNYLELREELLALGHHFHTGTDTEVILASWLEWGKDCLHRFNGDWAFAILDLRNSPVPTLFLARDRYGVKPLYFSHNQEGFWFASEIKALVGRVVPFRPNGHAIRRFLLSGELPPATGDATFFEGIHQLRPGEAILLQGPSPEQGKIYPWYDLEDHSQPESGIGIDIVVEEMRDHLTEAVKLRLRADVPVGSCLSGGVDSSAVVGTMRELLAGPERDVHSFSAVYHDEGPHNERRWIDQVVAASGARAHFVFPDDQSLGKSFDRLVWHQDEPFQTASIFAQWCVMEKAREEGITVLLDGQAADELLAGYQPGTYQEQFLEWIQEGQHGLFLKEWMNRKRVTGLSWFAALRELWQILLLGPTGVLSVSHAQVDPVSRLAALGFREDQIATLYSGNETDYEALLSGLREDLAKEIKWEERLRKHPEQAEELDARLAKKRNQIVSRRIKLARFRDRGSWLFRLKNDWKVIRARIEGHPSHRLRDRLLAQTTRSNLQHLLRFEDRNSMAHSIEARVPFTDPRLVEWSFSRANPFKIREGWTKWPLRKAAKERVPPSILWRSDKVGFETPDLKMAQRLLEEIPRDLEKAPILLDYLRPEAIREKVDAVNTGRADTDEAKLVWRWLVLDSWHRQFSAT